MANSTPKTDSVESSSDPDAGSTCASPVFCKTSVAHDANAARYARLSHVPGSRRAKSGIGSTATAPQNPRIPVTKNCTHVSTSTSCPSANFATVMTSSATNRAEMSVMASPNPSVSESEPDREMNPTPATQTTAAAMLNRVGRLRKNSHPRNGTSTQ